MTVKKVLLLVTLMTLTPYSCAIDTQIVISESKFISNKLHWFHYNHPKTNPRKFHLRLRSKTPTDVSIGDASLTTSTKKTLLEIFIDQNSVLTNMCLPFVVKPARNYRTHLCQLYIF